MIGLLIPHNDPRLLENDLADIALSPFTLVFENAGFPWAAALMNVVVLTTVLSAGNSGMYAATRLVHTLAQEGRLPSTFAKVSASGVPRNEMCIRDRRMGTRRLVLTIKLKRAQSSVCAYDSRQRH